ncbi:hypothetical protein L345_10171, partial [Ophiophagus hannah]
MEGAESGRGGLKTKEGRRKEKRKKEGRRRKKEERKKALRYSYDRDPLGRSGKPAKDIYDTSHSGWLVGFVNEIKPGSHRRHIRREQNRITELGGTLEPYAIPDKWLSVLFFKASSDGELTTSAGKLFH